MGRIIVSLKVGSYDAPDRRIECDALVDTGAYCLTLPTAWKARLGSLRLSRVVELETADHRTVAGELCGPVTIQVEGFDETVGEVLFVDMEPADGRYQPLLGYLTLEQCRIAVDVVGHRLLPVPRLDLKGTSRPAS